MNKTLKQAASSMFVLLMLVAMSTNAEDLAGVTNSEVSRSIIDIKQSVLELNRGLYQLEQDLLHPVTTQVAIYLSLKFGVFFEPHSVRVWIDNKPSAQHLYTQKQLDILKQGAVHPLAELNVGFGMHRVKAVVSGLDANKKSRELVIEKNFEKTAGPLYIEFKVQDDRQSKTSSLVIGRW